MKKAREAELEPEIRCKLHWIGPITVNFQVCNIGRGAIKDLKLEYWFVQDDQEHNRKMWIEPLLDSKETMDFFIKPNNFSQLADQYDFIKMHAEGYDILGRTHKFNDSINLKEVLGNINGNTRQWERSMLDIVKNIGEQMKGIKRELHNRRRAR